MLSKNSLKPLELVVSAIHCLRENKGSSPQNILRYLVGKYNVDTETLRPHVQTGLRRGLSFGMITQKSGLYRLNNILGNPDMLNLTKVEKPERIKLRKRKKPIKRRKLRHIVGKKGKRRFLKSVSSSTAKNKRRTKKMKEKRKKIGGTSRRTQNDLRRRTTTAKQRRLKAKGKKLKLKVEKAKKDASETQQIKHDDGEVQKSENAKDGEVAKPAVKI